MIIRHKHRGRFAVVPNAIFDDQRLSFGAKGVLAYLLSLPPNWEVRHDQLQRKLGIGRKLLTKALSELIKAGYVTRDESQMRDEFNRFTTLNYVVSDVPDSRASDAPFPARPEPKRARDSGNNKKTIKTDSNNPFSKSLPAAHGKGEAARQMTYSDLGQRALAAGNSPVFVGSRPYQAWCDVRGGLDAMPGFVDRVLINGRAQEVVWMPSVYPPKRKEER
jgi:hypothetical protein